MKERNLRGRQRFIKRRDIEVEVFTWPDFSLSLYSLNHFSVFIDDFLACGCGDLDQFPQLEFEQLPFNHPLFIMYSSGTTGAPKCMVHSAGVRTTALCLQ